MGFCTRRFARSRLAAVRKRWTGVDTTHAKCFGTRLEPFEIYDFGDLDARHDCIVNVASFLAVITRFIVLLFFSAIP